MKLTLLSLGNNRKLAENIPVFNLPQGVTCPGKTAVCQKICYALKAERMYPAAKAMRARNLLASKNSMLFIPSMMEELDYLIAHKGTKFCRIHESGDFYTQAYLDAWIEIAAGEPEIPFLAYTKSFHLDFSKAPKNMKIYLSTDSSSPSINMGLLGAYPLATIVLKGETPPAGAHTCIHTDPRHYCGSQCELCWNGKVSVYFPQH
jgi:hypothetical protein